MIAESNTELFFFFNFFFCKKCIFSKNWHLLLCVFPPPPISSHLQLKRVSDWILKDFLLRGFIVDGNPSVLGWNLWQKGRSTYQIMGNIESYDHDLLKNKINPRIFKDISFSNYEIIWLHINAFSNDFPLPILAKSLSYTTYFYMHKLSRRIFFYSPLFTPFDVV